MATASQVIKAALQKIVVQASEADLEPDEYEDAMFTMNNFMLALDADGITLGYTEVSSLGDTITIPQGALRGLIYNLARELAPEYDAVLSPQAELIANQGLKIMEKLGVSVLDSNYPSTLPIGSGNEGTGDETSRYFAENESSILAETTGSIALESGTESAIT